MGIRHNNMSESCWVTCRCYSSNPNVLTHWPIKNGTRHTAGVKKIK